MATDFGRRLQARAVDASQGINHHSCVFILDRVGQTEAGRSQGLFRWPIHCQNGWREVIPFHATTVQTMEMVGERL